MQSRREVRICLATMSLLDQGLLPRLAHDVTGLSLRRVRALIPDRMAGRASPRGRPPKAGRFLTRLGKIYHATLYMECVREFEVRCKGPDAPELRPAILSDCAFAYYRYCLEVLDYHCTERLLPGTTPLFLKDRLTVNEACTILRDRDEMIREVCGDCGNPAWRWHCIDTPRGCPCCCARRQFQAALARTKEAGRQGELLDGVREQDHIAVEGVVMGNAVAGAMADVLRDEESAFARPTAAAVGYGGTAAAAVPGQEEADVLVDDADLHDLGGVPEGLPYVEIVGTTEHGTAASGNERLSVAVLDRRLDCHPIEQPDRQDAAPGVDPPGQGTVLAAAPGGNGVATPRHGCDADWHGQELPDCMSEGSAGVLRQHGFQHLSDDADQGIPDGLMLLGEGGRNLDGELPQSGGGDTLQKRLRVDQAVQPSKAIGPEPDRLRRRRPRRLFQASAPRPAAGRHERQGDQRCRTIRRNAPRDATADLPMNLGIKPLCQPVQRAGLGQVDCGRRRRTSGHQHGVPELCGEMGHRTRMHSIRPWKAAGIPALIASRAARAPPVRRFEELDHLWRGLRQGPGSGDVDHHRRSGRAGNTWRRAGGTVPQGPVVGVRLRPGTLVEQDNVPL
ncbi:hypothetical protein [Pseudoroseomonas sp. WGS1072]|uniref:hypothetical protein n=1 Tax=Roseomonas sp. WGS1072 TaxID=3366816 RepID=UPI003BF0062D